LYQYSKNAGQSQGMIFDTFKQLRGGSAIP